MNKLSNWAAMLITLYTTSSSVISGLAKWLPASIHACLQDCVSQLYVHVHVQL